jgi:hypothetical protein
MKKVLESIRAALAALAACGIKGQRAESIETHLKSCESNAQAELDEADKAVPRDEKGMRTDGPTLEEYVKAGYKAETYPPVGYSDKRIKKEGGFASAVLLAVIGLIALALLALSARSETVYQSFGATNYIAGSTTITSFPTNVATTNAAGTIGQRTGAAIFVGNQEHVNFVFMSEPVASDTTNSITFKLIRGYSSSTPTITSNTFGNATFAAFPQWETQPTLTLAAQQQGTNSSCWSTNLAGYIGGASHIGIYSEQNGFSTALTNFDVGLSKKIVPIVYK